MAGRSWKDLNRGPKKPSAGSAAPAARTAQQQAPAHNKQAILDRATEQSPQLARLMEQRRALENRMQNLSSGGNDNAELDPRDTARFPVTSFADSQAQQRQWEARRRSLQQRGDELRRQARAQNSPNSGANNGSGGRALRALTQVTAPGAQPATALRDSARSAVTDNVGRWLSQRDQQRDQQREQNREQHRNDSRRGRSALDSLANVGTQMRDSLSNSANQLRELDRKLAAEGLEEDRAELKKMGADKLIGASDKVNKYSKMVEGPMGAVTKIDNNWGERRDRIEGPMDRSGPYVDRSRRRLSTDTGGSGDLFERSERNRARALDRRREQRRQDERDEARHERARRRRSQIAGENSARDKNRDNDRDKNRDNRKSHR